MLCWMAKAAAGGTRSSHSAAPKGRTEATSRTYGSAIATIAAVTAAAPRRRMGRRARAGTPAGPDEAGPAQTGAISPDPVTVNVPTARHAVDPEWGAGCAAGGVLTAWQ